MPSAGFVHAILLAPRIHNNVHVNYNTSVHIIHCHHSYNSWLVVIICWHWQLVPKPWSSMVPPSELKTILHWENNSICYNTILALNNPNQYKLLYSIWRSTCTVSCSSCSVFHSSFRTKAIPNTALTIVSHMTQVNQSDVNIIVSAKKKNE